MNPVEEFHAFLKESAKTKRPLADRQASELQMWHDWKDSGEDPEKFDPLFNSMQGFLQSRIRKFQGRTPLPPQAVETEFNRQFLNAMRNFDPNRGVKLNTYVYYHLKNAQRMINKYQNVGRIPETRSYGITTFKMARSDLDQMLGREPNSKELADRLGWSEKEVGRMEAELSHKDLPTSGFADDPTEMVPSVEREQLELLRYELAPEETVVYDYLLGTHGKPALSATQIAQRMGWSDSKVSRIRKKIANKAKKYPDAF